jgi:hypothetical protein
VVAVAASVATFIGLLFAPALGALLTAWAAVVAAVGLLVGVLRLISVHWRRALKERNPASAALLLAFTLMVAAGLADALGLTGGSAAGLFILLIAPLEAALAGLIGLLLAFSLIWVLRRRRSWHGLLFLVSALLFLLASSAIPGALGEALRQAGELVETVVVDGGMRGLLIGIGLGIVTTAARFLIAAERPYEP